MDDAKKPDEPLDMTGEPEWETVEQERDYWKKLANAYAAKLTAIQRTMEKQFEAEFDPQTGEVFVYEKSQ